MAWKDTGWTRCPIEEVPAEVLAAKPPAPRKRTLAPKKRDCGCHLTRLRPKPGRDV